MNVEELQNKLKEIRKGTSFTVIQEKKVEPKKKFRHLNIRKESEIKGRLVNYEKQEDVQIARKEGMGHRESNLEKVADHIYRDKKSNDLKFCFCPSKLRNHRGKSRWFLDEKEVDYSEVEEYITSRDKPKDGGPKYYTLRLDRLKNVIQKGNKQNATPQR